MTIDSARRWIVYANFLITMAALVFFFMAPAVGYPLTWDQSLRVLEIILPVSIGYLVSAALFLFFGGAKSPSSASLSDTSGLLGVMIRAPLLIVGIACVVVIFAFWYTNRSSAPPGSGMSVDFLCVAVTVALSLLTGITSLAVARLFQ